jgi:hypothetical protein
MMPEDDDRGERLRRDFLRQAPQFDMGASLREKVSALVRRRQRVRRTLAIAGAAVVVAAVAVPLSALRSAPVGHGITPATASTSSSTTPSPATTTPATTPTTAAQGLRPLSCDTLDLWTTPSGTAITTTATLGDVTATLTGTNTTTAGDDPALTAPELSVAVGSSRFSETVAPPAQADTVIPWSLAPVPSTPSPPNSDALCLARFPGKNEPTVVLGLDTGLAHCCTVVRAITLSPEGLGTAVDDDVGNPGAALDAEGNDDVIVTADNAFAYQFASFAESAMPIKVLQFTGGHFVDVTGQDLGLVGADASKWWMAFNANSPGNRLGQLAAWVADECVLGQSTSAWATVDQLEANAELTGPAGWPENAAYVQALKTFLTTQGYC